MEALKMRTKILSIMMMAAMIAVLFAGMAHADTQRAEAPQWTVGDKWAFGADKDLNEVAQPYIELVKQEASTNPEVSNVDATVSGTAGAWATFEVTGATDTEYTVDYRMSGAVNNLKAHASATGMMPKAGTYSYSDTPPTTQMTMSADVSLDHATVINGQIKFVKDTMAVKSVTIDVEQKTALTFKGKNLPGEDMLGDMGGLMGGSSDYGGYDSGGTTTIHTYPSMTLSHSMVGGNWNIVIDSVSGDQMTWGNMNIDVFDVNVTLIESVNGTSSTTFTVYHSDGTLVTNSDPVQAGDYLIVDGSAGVDNLDFYYQDDYYGLVYLESVYNLASTTRDIYGYDGNYTVSYQDYDISFTEEFHTSITTNFNPPLNLLDFPIIENETWDVYSNITVSGTYGGTIDATGLPDKAVQQIKNETGQDFPIDIAKLDMGTEDMKNGVISGSDTIDFSLRCTGTMQITDENGNSLTVFKISPYSEYPLYRGDTDSSVLYSPDRKFIAGAYSPAGASPVIPGMSGVLPGASMLGSASTSDTTFTYANYSDASSNIDKTDTEMSSIGEPSLLDFSNPIFILIILVVVILIVIVAVAMRKKKPQQPQMAPYPDPYAPQQPQYQQYQQQPQQPPAYYPPPPQPQEPPQPPQKQTPPPPTY